MNINDYWSMQSMSENKLTTCTTCLQATQLHNGKLQFIKRINSIDQ